MKSTKNRKLQSSSQINTKTQKHPPKKNARVSPLTVGRLGGGGRVCASLSGTRQTRQPRAGPGRDTTQAPRRKRREGPQYSGKRAGGRPLKPKRVARRQTTRSLTAGPFGDRAAVYLLRVATFAHPGPSPNLPAAACQHTVHNRPRTVADPQLPPALSLPPTCIWSDKPARTQTEGLLRERVATDLPGDPPKDLTNRRIFASERGSLQAL